MNRLKSTRTEKEEHWNCSSLVRGVWFQDHHYLSIFFITDSMASHLTFIIVLRVGLLRFPFYRGENGDMEMVIFLVKLDRSWNGYLNWGESDSNVSILKYSPIKCVDKANTLNKENKESWAGQILLIKIKHHGFAPSFLPSFLPLHQHLLKASYLYVFHNYCQNHVLPAMEAHLSTSQH